jgi:hypothetical protein
MPLVQCEACLAYWTHCGPGPIEDHCTSYRGPPGEYLLVYEHPKQTSRL